MTSLSISSRTDAIFREQQFREHSFTDRLFAALMAVQFFGCIIVALVISPRTWIGEQSMVHAHIWAAIGLGGTLAALPIVLAIRCPGEVMTRQVIAVSQALFSALLIHLMGGRIEAHFHVFGSLAFLAFYRDIRVLLTATCITAADHCLRGVFWPESVFGALGAGNWRWVEHAAWVAFEDLFLIISIIRTQKQARALAHTTVTIEQQKNEVETLVDERTQELSKALADAQAADKAKSDFLANMSHEIRTPMTAILGYADLLQNEKQSSERDVDQTIRSINSNAQHLLTVINDVLDVSKIEAGQLTVERVTTDLIPIVNETIELIASRTESKNVDVNAVFSTPMPKHIQTDPTRLRQILLNLLGNAIKFTEQGQVTTHVSCDAHRQRLLISVIDTGIGMSPEQVQEIAKFKAFTQADESMTRRFGGTGLGLRISNALASELGQGIEIDSALGIGSRFSFEIDTGDLTGVEMRIPGEQPKETHMPQPALSETTGIQKPKDKTLAGLHILLAEDGPDNQRLIAFHLKKAGARVTVCDNGLIAVNTIEQLSTNGLPDVVLMDMQMPEMDGYTATRHLRGKGFDLPILAVTAHAMDGDRQKCLDAGCDDYLTKPIDKVALIESCQRYAYRVKGQGSAA